MDKIPLIMGVLNVTPDSFSDGGKFYNFKDALIQAEKLVNDGADIIDVGGESSRPGAMEVSTEEELRRTTKVIKAINDIFGKKVMISIDTVKSEVAKAALDNGAVIINDISAGKNPQTIELVKSYNATIILMHMKGSPKTMQEDTSYPKGVIAEIREFLEKRTLAFELKNVKKEKIWIDPGIGFGKTFEQNLTILRNLDSFSEIGSRIVIGTSRKSFLGRIINQSQIEFRESPTIASNLWAYTKGATVFRVHNVCEMKRALITWKAIEKHE